MVKVTRTLALLILLERHFSLEVFPSEHDRGLCVVAEYRGSSHFVHSSAADLQTVGPYRL